jgi:hypothetical protein
MIPQYSTDPTARVQYIDEQIAGLLAWQETVIAKHAELSHRLAALNEQQGLDTPQTRTERSDLEVSLAQLRNGITDRDGVIPELATFISRPGLDQIERSLAKLRAERDEWSARIGVDPDASAGSFRLTTGKHFHSGRMMKAGEVVELTHRQAVAWADKFERVAEPELARG